MKNRVFCAAVFGLAIGMITFSMPAMAKTFTGTAAIAGTTGSLVEDSECTTGYSEQCPSSPITGATCDCFSISGAKVGGTLLGGEKGTAVVDVTIDTGDPLSDLPTSCYPVYGVGVLTLKGKLPGTVAINFQGAFCSNATDTGKTFISGGWQVIGSSIGAVGLGTLSGKGVVSDKDLHVTLTGSVSVPE